MEKDVIKKENTKLWAILKKIHRENMELVDENKYLKEGIDKLYQENEFLERKIDNLRLIIKEYQAILKKKDI